MRIDPAAVIAHTLTTAPTRLLVAWLAGALGAFTPVLLAKTHYPDLGDLFLWTGILPFILLGAALKGWWTLITLPLLGVFLYRVIIFVRDDGTPADLPPLIILPALIALPGLRDLEATVIVLASIGIYLAVQRYRRRAELVNGER